MCEECAATPENELMKRLFDPSHPKTELEHFAAQRQAEANEQIEKLEKCIERLDNRILKMYAGDISPESRLSGYAVIGKRQVERIKELCAQLAEAQGEVEKLRTNRSEVKKLLEWAKSYFHQEQGGPWLLDCCLGKIHNIIQQAGDSE